MRKRHVDEHDDAITEPDDQMSIASNRHAQTPQLDQTSINGDGQRASVVPLDPEILKTQPIMIVASKKPLQQTNNLPVNGVHKVTPVVAGESL